MSARVLDASQMREKGIGTIVIYECGLNKNGDVFFAESTLDSAEVFEGVKMWLNHPGMFEESRDVRNGLGLVTKVKANRAEKRAEGQIFIAKQEFRDEFANMAEAGFADRISFSIYARAKSRPADPDSKGEQANYRIVESFVPDICNSVDHVWEGSAGGKMLKCAADLNKEKQENEAMELKDALKKIDELQAQLSEKTESEAAKATQAKLDEITAENVRLADENKKFAEAQSKARIAEAINKSELPDPSKARLRESVALTATDAEIAAAIESEAKYLKSIGVEPKKATPGTEQVKQGVTGLGAGESAPSADDVAKEELAKKGWYDFEVQSLVSRGKSTEVARQMAQITTGYIAQ